MRLLSISLRIERSPETAEVGRLVVAMGLLEALAELDLLLHSASEFARLLPPWPPTSDLSSSMS